MIATIQPKNRSISWAEFQDTETRRQRRLRRMAIAVAVIVLVIAAWCFVTVAFGA
jgi:hypothetical protein